MNKKITLTAMLVFLLAAGLKAQDQYKVRQDDQGNKVLIGKLNERILANDSSFRWFYLGVNRYKPNTEWTKYINYYRDSFKVVVFAGTWNVMSQQLLPAFYRTMMASGYPMNKITLYGVDHQLHALGNQAEQYDIEKIPTFIILHDGKELGRIEQHPIQSIEANIVAILQRKFTPEVSETDTSGN